MLHNKTRIATRARVQHTKNDADFHPVISLCTLCGIALLCHSRHASSNSSSLDNGAQRCAAMCFIGSPVNRMCVYNVCLWNVCFSLQCTCFFCPILEYLLLLCRSTRRACLVDLTRLTQFIMHNLCAFSRRAHESLTLALAPIALLFDALLTSWCRRRSTRTNAHL